MDSLLSQFSILANQALDDKNFDPSRIDDLLRLFEAEAYNSWSAMEADHQKSSNDAHKSLQEAEDYLNRVMEAAMDDYRRTTGEMDKSTKAEMSRLVRSADAVKKVGYALGNAATVASKKYMAAAAASAKNGFSSSSNSKVRPC